MLFAPTCPVCLRRGRVLCPGCAAALRAAPNLPPPPGVDDCLALFAYEGAGRELVARLKYRNLRATLPGLAVAVSSLVDAWVDHLTWVPTTPARRRRRGFDHAELLARAVGRRVGRPARPLLRRAEGDAQTGRSLDARRAGPVLTCRRPLEGHVAVVDDVVTSGATASAAARALRTAGATGVTLLAVARTPLKAPAGRSDTLGDARE